ncbi:MAG: helical backbone metal receptor [Proteobacteria bacterium]|nr:helical backbone metal receptor [Pseudomonadota bacterium]
MAFRLRDALNRDVIFIRPPQRIVSLVPSDTETLFALGAGDRVVGRTRYCVEPVGQVEDIPLCGGTKDIDVTAVARLQPDLVLCNREENARPPLEALAQNGHQVYVSFPRRVADGLAHVARLARIVGVAEKPDIRDLIRRGHHMLGKAQRAAGLADATEVRAAPGDGRLRVFVPIWKDPLMTMSGDTFGSDMLAMAGARNIFGNRERRYPLAADLGHRPAFSADQIGDRDTRYPRISTDELIARAPEAVLLPDEPYSFDQTDVDHYCTHNTPAARRGAVRLVSGKDLFWYGARSMEALPRLRRVIAELAALGK